MDDKDNKDRGLNKLVIDEGYYKNLVRMLNSSPEDQVVALQCIKPLNKQRNYVAVAFLRKNSKCSQSLWDANCKTHLRYQLTLGIPDGSKITFAEIHKAMAKELKFKEENSKFFTMRYIDFLKENLVKMDFVESVEINVKIKGYE